MCRLVERGRRAHDFGAVPIERKKRGNPKRIRARARETHTWFSKRVVFPWREEANKTGDIRVWWLLDATCRFLEKTQSVPPQTWPSV